MLKTKKILLVPLAIVVVAMVLLLRPVQIPISGQLRTANGDTVSDGFYDLRVVGFDQVTGKQTIAQDFADVFISDGEYELPISLRRYASPSGGYLQVCRTALPTDNKDGVSSDAPEGCKDPVEQQNTFVYAECPQEFSINGAGGLAGSFGQLQASLSDSCVRAAFAEDGGESISLADSNAVLPSVISVQGSHAQEHLIGPQGPQGERGLPGPQGPEGASGSSSVGQGIGAAGPQGPLGDAASDDQTLSYALGTQILSVSGGNSVDLGSLLDNTDELASLSCIGGQVAQWDGSIWKCAFVGGVDTDDQILSIDASNNLVIQDGNSVSLSPYLDDTNLTEAEVDAFANNNGYLTSYTETDGIIGNEVVNATSSQGLVRSGAGTSGDPYTLGLITCADTEILKYSTGTSSWGCTADVDTDTDTTYSAGTGISFVGTVISSTLGTSIQDSEVDDDLTISAAGSVADGALSSNVSLLGSSIESSEITDGTITFADINQNSCSTNQVMQWNGTAWACTNAAVDTDTTYTAGNGLDLSGTTFAVDSPTCTGTTKLQWNGTAFVCAADVDTDTNLTEAEVDAFANNNGYLTSYTETDGIIGNEVVNATSSQGLVRSGAGTSGDPYTLGLITCADTEILKYSTGTSSWGCTADVDTDTDTTYSAGTGISFVGTVISSTLGTSIQDSEVDDDLTISAAGSVADGALSSNVSLLGSSIESSEITDGTITFADINQNSCSTNQVMQWNGTAWACTNAAVDTDTTYTAGNGLDLSGTTFAVDSPTCTGTTKLQWNGTAFVCAADVDTDTNLTEAEVDAFANNNGYLTSYTETDGIIGNEVVNATSSQGLVRSGAGTSGDPYTLGLITCADTEILKYSTGTSSWGCTADVDTDTDTTYSAGTGISFVGTVISSTLGTSIQDSEVDDDLTISAAGSVADGALSSNVSLLGSSIESSEITDGTITFADINQNSCSTNQVMQWNGTAWACTNAAVDTDTTYTAGNGLDLSGTTFAVDSPTCTGTTKLQWNGTAFVCAADVDTDTNLTEAEVDAFANNNGYLTSYTETDGIIGNEVVNATSSQGLVRSGAGTSGDPYTLGLITCADTEILKYSTGTSSWGCTADVDTDTDTTYSAGTGISFVGTVISSTLGTSIQDSEVDDDLTISAAGSVADGALSSNVSLLGSSIESSEITDGTITFADINQNSCSTNQVMQWNGTAWACTNAAVDTDTTYTAGNGLDLSGTTFAVDSPTCTGTTKLQWNGTAFVCAADVDTDTNLTEAEVDAFANNNGYLTSYTETDGIIGNEVVNATSSQGLVRSGAGTSGDPYTLGLITCADTEILKYSTGTSSWGCTADVDTDTDTTYSAGTGISFVGTVISSTLGTSIQDSEVDDDLTISAAGSVADGALSSNVSLLGSSIESSEITDGTITFADINQNSCSTNQVMQWNGTAWACTNAAVDTDTTYTAGNGLDLSGTTFAVDSPTCTGTTKLQWNGTAFVCAADVDTDTNLTEAEVDAFANNNGYLTSYTETDGIIGNEVVNATSSQGLVRSGAGTSGDPYTLGLITCADTEILKYSTGTSSWGCTADVDTDTDTTYSAGTGISFVGTVISSTLGTSIQDSEVDDDLTISAAGSVADGALSSNVSLLGSSIESSEITDGTITFADINQNSCSTNQVMQWNGTAWACTNAAVDTDTTYTAGNGLDLSGTTFAVDSPTCTGTTKLQWNGTAFVCAADVDTDTNLTEAEVDAFANNNGYLTSYTETDGIIGNEVVNATSSQGLVRSGAGTSGDPYTLGLITCADTEILKYSTGTSSWGCTADVDTDTDTTYSAGTGISFVGTVISSTLGTSIQDSEVDDDLTISAAGSVADGALSSNVSLLGSSIESSEITDGTITFADINQNSCSTNQVMQWNGTAWACTNAAVDTDTTYTAGNGLDLSGTTFAVDSPTCTGTTKLQWNGTAFVCAADVDTDTNLTEAEVDAFANNNGYLTSYTETDGIIGNEVVNATSSQGLVRSGAGTSGDPYTLGLITCADTEILKYSTGTSSWGCTADVDTDTDTTYSAGTGISFVGTVISSTLGTSIQDSEVDDDLTISAAGSVADGALSSNVSLLGSSIESSEITDGSVANVDLANSSLTITSGSGLTDGGSVALGSSTTLNIGAGDGITVNADDVAIDAATTGTTLLTSSNSGLEVGPDGVRLLGGCSNGDVLSWNSSSSVWQCVSNNAIYTAIKTADYTNNTQVHTDVADINFPIAANEEWYFEFNLQLNADAGDDARFRLNCPVGATGIWGVESTEQAVTVGNISCNASTTNVPQNDGNEVVVVSGTVSNGGTAGTVQLQMRENGSGDAANRITVFSGSSVHAMRIPIGTLVGSGGASFTDFNITDTSNTETIDDGDTLTFAAGAGLNVLVGATDTVTYTNTLGATIETGEITDGTILLSDLADNGCATDEIMKYNGSAWICGGNDAIVGNELTNVAVNGGLVRTGLGTGASPYNVGLRTDCAADEILRFEASVWVCSAPVYEKIVIWAEDNGSASSTDTSGNEWSFGNGAVGAIGIPVAEDWEIYAVSFDAETFGTSVSINIVNRNGGGVLHSFTANSDNYNATLGVPVAVSAGDTLGFDTTATTGTSTDVRAAVWLRRLP